MVAATNAGYGADDRRLATDAVATMFDEIGPAVLLTHSAGGVYGWETATKAAMSSAFTPTSRSPRSSR